MSCLPAVTSPDLPTVKTQCTQCQGLVTLQCEAPSAIAAETTEQTWLCPWCWGSNAAMFPDQLVWVGEGRQPEPAVCR